MIPTQKERRRNKLFKDVFGSEFGACFAEIWPFAFCVFFKRTLTKNRHGNFAVSSFVGFSIEENIHESESTRTPLAKAIKLNMYIHNIHWHIFSMKLISPVIAVYKQTVIPISLNCPTIPYKNFGGYPWKKIEKKYT